MFFAYNNGITATADDIDIEDLPKGRAITKIKNLQIVNGGQTTASIYSAYKNKKDVSKVFVQMKLSVIMEMILMTAGILFGVQRLKLLKMVGLLK